MVNSWSPDPQQSHCSGEAGPISSLSVNAIEVDSSDSENEELPNNGYELLPMTPNEDVQLDSDEDEEADDSDHEEEVHSPEAESSSNQQLEVNKEDMGTSSSSCNSETNGSPREEMDPELMEQVKTAMSGFTLPLTAVPNWAFHVPEEEWRSHLVERMHCIQRGTSSPIFMYLDVSAVHHPMRYKSKFGHGAAQKPTLLFIDSMKYGVTFW
ncbi:hypothetical protein J437_LFUL007023 [Ladona fulva]|uniref:Male-enhanced antigen 1 n=1 Tax=Ladona fulva TaxID=123851 RepID=A0A8K0NXP8_LADFU|nr:hypothetical protein J437_LFUL007023 [Ladona fulva]